MAVNQDALELLAIRNVMAAYNVAGDRMRIADLAATFTTDGVLETPTATYRGRAEILAGLGGGPRDRSAPTPAGPRPTLVRHNLTTSHIVLTGSGAAEGRTYFLVLTDVGPDHAGHYVDRMSKAGADWRFEHRCVRIDWMSEQSRFPSLRTAYEARRAAKTG